ncbi:MAG: DUF3592 domain-containing protein [Chthoniobacterales bacterium]
MSDHTLFACLFGGFGLIVAAILVASLREAAAMKRWPVAKGRILSSRVEEYTDIVASRSSPSRARIKLYRPIVTYEYTIGGRRFQSNRITQSPAWNRGAPDFAEQITQRYPAGSVIDVRYNAKRPTDSVLEPSVPSWKLGFAIVVALFGLAIYMYFR